MGYHVTILRTENGQPRLIARAELDALVASSPDYRLRSDSLGKLELVAARDGAEVLRLYFQNGALWTKNPDEASLQIMLNIADQLGARVRGDELETYRTLDDTFIHPDDQAEHDRARGAVRALRLRTRLRALAFHAVPVALALMAGLVVSRLTGRW
jgi:hypothetical protein